MLGGCLFWAVIPALYQAKPCPCCNRIMVGLTKIGVGLGRKSKAKDEEQHHRTGISTVRGLTVDSVEFICNIAVLGIVP